MSHTPVFVAPRRCGKSSLLSELHSRGLDSIVQIAGPTMIDMRVLIGKVHEEVSLIQDYKYKCDWCNERVFYVPADQAYVMGHIYTEMGLREFKISQTCEFCFDGMFS